MIQKVYIKDMKTARLFLGKQTNNSLMNVFVDIFILYLRQLILGGCERLIDISLGWRRSLHCSISRGKRSLIFPGLHSRAWREG